jgi:hypothetical protein
LLVTYLGKRKLTLSIGVSWGDKADEVNEWWQVDFLILLN